MSTRPEVFVCFVFCVVVGKLLSLYLLRLALFLTKTFVLMIE